MNEMMRADLEERDLQERDGIALRLIVTIMEADPLKRPLSHRQLMQVLGKELRTEIKSTEITTRILNRLRRCSPPLVTPGGHVGRASNIVATAAGKQLVKKWLKSEETPK